MNFIKTYLNDHISSKNCKCENILFYERRAGEAEEAEENKEGVTVADGVLQGVFSHSLTSCGAPSQ